MAWKRVAQVITALLCLLIAVAILFPLFAQGHAYSGPGLIGDVLLFDANGKQIKNRPVQLYMRGRSEIKATLTTDELGELHVDRTALRVDGIVGFERIGTTKPDAVGWRHMIFCEGNPGRPIVMLRSGPSSNLPIDWPTPEHPHVSIK